MDNGVFLLFVRPRNVKGSTIFASRLDLQAKLSHGAGSALLQ